MSFLPGPRFLGINGTIHCKSDHNSSEITSRSILHDPEVFPDPESFRIDRWLDEKGEIRGDLKMFGFGFGRRYVTPSSVPPKGAQNKHNQGMPGPTRRRKVRNRILAPTRRLIALTFRSLYINTALVLWAFDIVEDPSSPIDTMGFSDGAVIRPSPFKVIFKPRVANLEPLLKMA